MGKHSKFLPSNNFVDNTPYKLLWFHYRPIESREPDKKRMNDFLTEIQGLKDKQGLPYESNWEAIPPDYDDYEITDEKNFYFNQGSVNSTPTPYLV